LPSEHLFGDDVGFFTDAAGEELRVFEDGVRISWKLLAGEDVAHLGLDTFQSRVGREKVASSAMALIIREVDSGSG